MAHPTPILQTTRTGKRDPVHRLNQPVCWDKLEPKRRSACAGARARIVEPGPKERVLDRVVESEANSLLVILHYLLKNNTQFIGWNGAGQVVPPLPLRCHFMGGQLR
jgi:hypothetical protein